VFQSVDKPLCFLKMGVSLIACSVGFASCKTFGKQSKHPCFGRSPKAGRRDASPRIPPPGTDAGRVCQKALHDAEPTKHTQPFTTGKGFWVSARMPRWNAQRLCRTQSPQSVLIGIENLLYFYKNKLFLQAELLSHKR
jgi:hypothetical protein